MPRTAKDDRTRDRRRPPEEVAMERGQTTTQTRGGMDFLTRGEVARLLGVSPNTVARWARDGRIPCQMTLGGHRRFERNVIEDLVDCLRVDQEPRH